MVLSDLTRDWRVPPFHHPGAGVCSKDQGGSNIVVGLAHRASPPTPGEPKNGLRFHTKLRRKNDP